MPPYSLGIPRVIMFIYKVSLILTTKIKTFERKVLNSGNIVNSIKNESFSRALAYKGP